MFVKLISKLNRAEKNSGLSTSHCFGICGIRESGAAQNGERTSRSRTANRRREYLERLVRGAVWDHPLKYAEAEDGAIDDG